MKPCQNKECEEYKYYKCGEDIPGLSKNCPDYEPEEVVKPYQKSNCVHYLHGTESNCKWYAKGGLFLCLQYKIEESALDKARSISGKIIDSDIWMNHSKQFLYNVIKVTRKHYEQYIEELQEK